MKTNLQRIAYTLMLVGFMTSLGISQTTILSQDFEGGSLPAGWTLTQAAGSDGWLFGSNQASQYYPVPAHTVYACSNDDVCDCDMSIDRLITPALDFTSFSSPMLSFEYFIISNGGTWYSTGHVEVSTNGGTTWTNLLTIDEDDSDWMQGFVNLSAYGGNSNVMIAFRHNDNSTWGYGFSVDDILIYQPAPNDAEMTVITTIPYVAAPSSVSIAGTVTNVGLSAITAMDISWSDGTNTYTDNLTGLNIPAFGTYNFTHSTQLNVPSIGVYPIDVWVTLSGDANASNDELSIDINGVPFIPQKMVVGEEATGTWCGWCVRGHVFLEYMETTYPDTWIGIAVHNGDPMVVTAYDDGIGAYIGGYPSGLVDRVQLDTDPSDFEAAYDIQITEIPPVAVDIINLSWNSGTRQIFFDVSGDFVAQLTGDYRFNAVIYENNVTGTTSQYNQANYYSGGANGAMGGYESLPDPVPAAQMTYQNVGRALLGGWDGSAGSLPATIPQGSSYTKSYTHTLPAAQDENEIVIVGMVIDQSNGAIINAVKRDLMTIGMKEIHNGNIVLYPNPTTGKINIKNANNATIIVYNSLGQIISTADNTSAFESFDLSSQPNGTYIVKIITSDSIVNEKFIINK